LSFDCCRLVIEPFWQFSISFIVVNVKNVIQSSRMRSIFKIAAILWVVIKWSIEVVFRIVIFFASCLVLVKILCFSKSCMVPSRKMMSYLDIANVFEGRFVRDNSMSCCWLRIMFRKLKCR
jgi:hypothetical protein